MDGHVGGGLYSQICELNMGPMVGGLCHQSYVHWLTLVPTEIDTNSQIFLPNLIHKPYFKLKKRKKQIIKQSNIP